MRVSIVLRPENYKLFDNGQKALGAFFLHGCSLSQAREAVIELGDKDIPSMELSGTLAEITGDFKKVGLTVQEAFS